MAIFGSSLAFSRRFLGFLGRFASFFFFSDNEVAPTLANAVGRVWFVSFGLFSLIFFRAGDLSFVGFPWPIQSSLSFFF